MAQANTVSDRAEVVREKTMAILSSLTETARDFGLPDPSANLAQFGKKLADNAFQVLVVGEAKRGKSTFVNALIGRDILPTDVDIATCQVFRVCHADSEAYRLRFEDDSQQEISVADLPRYGSQLMQDADGVPQLDEKIIQWIEVDVPAHFLPANVRILDTPGLGALYAAHAKITNGLVPHADAVLFVLDSLAPIGEREIQLVTELLEVTPSIFFVQTKIDLFRREVWQQIQKRNQEILKNQFGDRLTDARVWPISSINLRKATQTGDEDYEIVSRHRELAAALKAFLFRVSGRSRSAEAILLAGHYHALSRQVLAVRLAALTEESKQARAEFQQRAQERRKQFEADWGDRGQKRRELLESIQRIATIGKQSIRNALQPGGDLERHFRDRIEELTAAPKSAELLRSTLPKALRGSSGRDTIAECGQLLQSLPQEVEDEALNLWQQVRQTTEAKCTEKLAPFALAAEGVMQAPDATSMSSQRSFASSSDNHQGMEEIGLKTLRFLTSTKGALSLLGIASSFWPVSVIAFVGMGVSTIVVEKRAQIRAGKQELIRSLHDLLQRLRNHLLFDVDLTEGRFNRVDECFNSLERSLAEAIGTLASRKLAQAQEEIERLGEESRLDDRARQEKAGETRRQLTDWDGIGSLLQEIRNELNELEHLQGAAKGNQASGQEGLQAK